MNVWEDCTVKTTLVRTVLLWLFISTTMSFAQEAPDLFQGYEGEWNHVSEQLISLAEATPPEKFAWRPASGVRSTSEVYMHIVRANFLMLNAIGSNRDFQGRRDSLAEAVVGGGERGSRR
jgi:hypothetical protein